MNHVDKINEILVHRRISWSRHNDKLKNKAIMKNKDFTHKVNMPAKIFDFDIIFIRRGMASAIKS